MSRATKVLFTAVFAAAVLVSGCTKPPVQEMDNARAAMKAAQEGGAEMCAGTEYLAAKQKLEAAEAKVADAEKGGNKSELYKQAKAELIEAAADFEKVKLVAAERAKVNEQAKAELSAAKNNLAANAEDGEKYSATYRDAKAKLDEAQGLIDKCEGEKALAVLKSVSADNDTIQKEIAEGKAASMRSAVKESTAAAPAGTVEDIMKYKVVRGDNLWNISKAKYLNPFMWPLIYWANKEQIKDPDLIFPGQEFKIRKDVDADKAKAIDYSKHRGPWSLFDGK
ncbi:MAG: LysM peptidoglycan-binding domain-containing protein [Deferribacterales bacterium]